MHKLKDGDHVDIEKGYKGKKPRTMIRLSEERRAAFREYKDRMQQVLGDLSD